MKRLGNALSLILCIALSEASKVPFVTMIGAPQQWGGPTCCLFDCPFASGRTLGAATASGYTANQESFLYALGDLSNVSSVLPSPRPTGLTRDSNPNSYSYCGKWLNAVWPDDVVPLVMHAYFHQEWRCDYARNSFTNKSVGYAVSRDGGFTFEPAAPQIIAGANFSSAHQTGEGDHGVVRVGDYLYLFFTEWDGWPGLYGGCTIGVARSRVADKGRPGTWLKYYNGSFSQPGVGGSSDLIRGMPGTSLGRFGNDTNIIFSIGDKFGGGMDVGWANGSDVLRWTPGNPLFISFPNDWNRQPSSHELFAYPSVTASRGFGAESMDWDDMALLATYLAPGATFADRYLVRRPLTPYLVLPSNHPVISLEALSVWCYQSRGPQCSVTWATTGPIVGTSMELRGPIAYLATSPVTGDLELLVECLIHTDDSSGINLLALTTSSDCGSPGYFQNGTVMRPSGYVAATRPSAAKLAWSTGMVATPDVQRAPVLTDVIGLKRCVRPQPALDFTVAASDRNCPDTYIDDGLLGYAWTQPTVQSSV